MFDDWGDVLGLLPFLALGSAALVLADRLNRRRSHRHMTAGRTVVSARAPGRPHQVLSPIWQSYRAVPRPGRLVLRHWLIPDEVSSIAVLDVEPEDRRPRTRDVWRLRVTGARVLTLRTPDGDVEVAVTADQVDWLRARLAGTESAEHD